jgi:hypothetical protein
MTARRTKAVTVPLYPKEKMAVEEAAREAGVSPTEFVRCWAHEGSRVRRLPYAACEGHESEERQLKR